MEHRLDRTASVPARISARTHRELRLALALRALGPQPAAPRSMCALIDLAWELFKAQRPALAAELARLAPPRDDAAPEPE